MSEWAQGQLGKWPDPGLQLAGPRIQLSASFLTIVSGEFAGRFLPAWQTATLAALWRIRFNRT
jgi:hypothetical protein